MSTAAYTRGIFGKNLRALVSQEKSVADVCRKLGVNRTQFNRYLSGSTFPRPDVLTRITHHFGVDARILTMPLEELEANTIASDVGAAIDRNFRHLMKDIDRVRLPDGLYMLTVPNLVDPNVIATQLIQLRTLQSGTPVVDWTLPLYFAHLVGTSPKWPDRRSSGLVLQHVDGVSMHFCHRSTRVVRVFYFTYGFQGFEHIHTGVAMSTSASPSGKLPAYPAVLQQVPRTFADHLKARRMCEDSKKGVIPEVYLQHARNTGFLT